jgi:hypothetical protein
MSRPIFSGNSNYFDGVTDQELEKELECRKKVKEQEAIRPLQNPDFSNLIETVKASIAIIQEEKYEPKNFRHYVFEAAMEAIYGSKIWDWYKNHV